MSPAERQFAGLGGALALVIAGAVYFVAVFLTGFIFGVTRTLFVAPQIGETRAVLLECPLMLIASWMVSRWSARRFKIPPVLRLRASMGGIAFSFLIAAEYVTARLFFHRSWLEFLANNLTFAGSVGLAAQVAFGIFPALQAIAVRQQT